MYVVYVCIYCILYVCSIIILDTAFKFDLELSLLFRIIVSMETTSNIRLNISPFLANLQITGDNFDYDLYRTKLDATIEKIDSLVDTLPVKQLSESEYDQWWKVSTTSWWSLNRSIVIEIRNTIGIYGITSKTYALESSIVFGSKILWYKQNGNERPEIDPLINGVWKDWLGNMGITESGGYVVVSLSDTGVEYLNGIADKVSSYTDTV